MFDLTAWPPDRVAQDEIQKKLDASKFFAGGFAIVAAGVILVGGNFVAGLFGSDDSTPSGPRPAWCDTWYSQVTASIGQGGPEALGLPTAAEYNAKCGVQ